MSAKTVFISYSHDSEVHRNRVLALSERLRVDGIETVIDRYEKGSPAEGWPRWMLNQLDRADSVLVICTETYYRRFRGQEVPGKGRGVDWEGALITQELYHERSMTLKFIPVLFTSEDEKFIPEPLRLGTFYTLTSQSAYQDLYDVLLEQAGEEPGAVGALKTKPRPRGTALTFDDPAETAATKPDDVPGELRCCLLITEAIANANRAAAGGGPSTALHRLLDLADRWMKEGVALLARFRDALGSDLADYLNQVCAETLPLLIAEARRELPPPGDGDSTRGDNEIFKNARRDIWYVEGELGKTLKANAAFVALSSSTQKWPILGFRDEAEYRDFLCPSVQTLARSSNPMQRDLFARLLAQPQFTPRQLTDEGYRQSVVMDTVNALVSVEWAKWTDLSELGSKGKGTMTSVGQRLLKQLIAVAGSATASPEQPEQLTIWRERLAFLLKEEAIVSDPAQKFTLKKQIAEARTKISELGG